MRKVKMPSFDLIRKGASKGVCFDSFLKKVPFSLIQYICIHEQHRAFTRRRLFVLDRLQIILHSSAELCKMCVRCKKFDGHHLKSLFGLCFLPKKVDEYKSLSTKFDIYSKIVDGDVGNFVRHGARI